MTREDIQSFMKHFYLDDTKGFIRHCQEDPSWQSRILATADAALNNTFTFTDKYEMERCTRPVTLSSPIDWDHIPFGDNEWCFALNRHTFLLALAKAYASSHEEKYRQAWIRLFEDFYRNNPPTEGNRNLSWRSLECGIRIENYIRSWELMRDSSPLPDYVVSDMTDFFREHIRLLKDTHTAFHRLSNWGVLQDHGLLLASLWCDDEEGQKLALERLDEEMMLQTLPDGVHWEQSTMYQAEVLHAAMDSILVAGRNGLSIPQRLVDNAHNMALGLARMLRPDGYSHLFGDSDEIDMRDMMARAAVIFEDGELAHYGKGGLVEDFYASFPLDQKLPADRHPSERSHYFKDSGNAILQLGDEDEVRFHCGLYGSGHGHFDQLHFDLWHKGTVILTDCGRYTYTDSGERYKTKGSRGHNTILINGREMATMLDSWGVEDFAEPLFTDARVEGPYKFLSAAHLGYMKEGAIPRRSIVTVADDFVVIFDQVVSSGPCDVETIFHCDDAVELDFSGDEIAFLSTPDGEGVDMLFFGAGLETERIQWPMAKRYNELISSPTIVTRRRCEGMMLNVTVIALRNDAYRVDRIPVVKILSSSSMDEEKSCGLSLECGDRRYTLSFIAQEVPTGGFLVRCGECDCYARVFIQKEGEALTVLKY